MNKTQIPRIMLALLLAAFVMVILTVTLFAPTPFGTLVQEEKEIYNTDTSVNLIDINSADIPELMTLKGMTREMAIDIMEYREVYRRFNRVEELTKISGITENMIKEWKPHICCK